MFLGVFFSCPGNWFNWTVVSNQWNSQRVFNDKKTKRRIQRKGKLNKKKVGNIDAGDVKGKLDSENERGGEILKMTGGHNKID